MQLKLCCQVNYVLNLRGGGGGMFWKSKVSLHLRSSCGNWRKATFDFALQLIVAHAEAHSRGLPVDFLL